MLPAAIWQPVHFKHSHGVWRRSTGHRIGEPQPLLSNISDELIAEMRERFAGSQADRAAAQAGKAAGKVHPVGISSCCSEYPGSWPGILPWIDFVAPHVKAACRSVCRMARQLRTPRGQVSAARQPPRQTGRSTLRGWTYASARSPKSGGIQLQTGAGLVPSTCCWQWMQSCQGKLVQVRPVPSSMTCCGVLSAAYMWRKWTSGKRHRARWCLAS